MTSKEEIQAEKIRELLGEREKLTLLIEDERKEKELYQKQVEIFRERAQLKIDGTRKGKLTPDFEFEKNPRYWELYAQELEIDYKGQCVHQDGQLESYDFKVEQYQNKIAEIDEQLKEFGVTL